MLDSNNKNEQRSGSDRRMATGQQVPPTGDGPVVFHYLLNRLTAAQYDDLLMEDLHARYNMGLQKYGTPLRGNNGRRAIVDLYQEIQDAIMYSAQGEMEGDKEAGQYLDMLISFGRAIAHTLESRTKEPDGTITR